MSADIEMPGSDLDIMRDVYMTNTQRAAFDRIVAEIVRLRGEVPYDRDLIARMLEDAAQGFGIGWSREAYQEQAALLRAADNASVAAAGTASIAQAEAKGDAFRYPPSLDFDEDGDPVYSFPLGPYRVSVVVDSNNFSVIATQGASIVHIGKDVPLTHPPAAQVQRITPREVPDDVLARIRDLSTEDLLDCALQVYARACAYQTEKQHDAAMAYKAEVVRRINDHPAGDALGAVPHVCDGKEQDEFEKWAKNSGYDMSQHPLHWLFLNERTDAARKGWRAALEYVAAALRPSAGEGKGHKEDGR